MDFHQYVRDRLPPLMLAREPEIVDELAQHLADLYAEARAAGFDHDSALGRAAAAIPEYPDDLAREIRSASRALPGLIADRWRASLDEPPARTGGIGSMFSDFRRDLRYAVRTMAHTPGFTLVVGLTMALAIGATSVVFSAVDALLLRDAPILRPDRVVSAYTSDSEGRNAFSSSSYPDYIDLRDSGALGGLAAFSSISLSMDLGGETLPVTGELVSGNYFDVLGVPLGPGRAFGPDEDRPGAPVRVAVIAHDFWVRHFAADPSIVGRPVSFNGEAHTVIGVTPRRFSSPVLGRAPEVWLPMALQPSLRPPTAGVRRALGHGNLLGVRDVRWLNLIGRLRDDSTLEQAASAFQAIARRLDADYPESNKGRAFTVVPLGEGPGVRTSSRPLLGMLGAAVLLVLLIACANVASLLLTRAVSRRREVAVRMAVGAGRARLVRQWLTEAMLLSLLGAAGGLLLSVWGAPLLHGFDIPESIALGPNARVLAFAVGVAVVSGLIFGIAPVVQAFRGPTLAALRDEGGAVATGARGSRLRRSFVVVQVALSVMLLVAAGLFLQTLRNAYSVDLGYQVNGALLADVNLDPRGYTEDTGQALYLRLLERVTAIPGVAAAGAARVAVLGGSARSGAVSTDGRPLHHDRSNRIIVRVNVVSDGYFRAMGIPIREGRDFMPSDDRNAQPVAIVSQSFAQRLWPTVSPIGQKLFAGPGPFEVVGVVADAVYANAIESQPPPVYYLPLAQNYESGVTLHLRTSLAPLSLVPALRQAVREIDPQLVLTRPRTLDEQFTRSLSEQRMMATLIALFGGVALALATVGLYGTMAHLAGQRTAEVGIRLALGASRSSIMRMMVGEGARLVALGALLGVGGALAGTRLLRTQLFGIAPTDPGTFAAVVALLWIAGVLACAIPARRAMRIDPAVALRNG